MQRSGPDTRAATVEGAAFGAFTTYNRDVWQDDPVYPAERVYVDRGETLGHLAPTRPYLQIKRTLLKRRDFQRVLLHGQIGSGKSMELKRLADDQEVRNALEIVSLSLADQLNLAVTVDIRMVLLALAYRLADHLVQEQGRAPGNRGVALPGERLKVLGEWLRILTPSDELDAPDKMVGSELVVGLKAGLLSKTVQVRSDDAVRRQLATEEAFAPSRMRRLVEELLAYLQQVSGRGVLVLLDDGDKIGDADAARDVFVHNVGLLLGLPCSIVVTVPFWLHFDPEFLAATRGAPRSQLANVKVVSRDDAETLLEPGRRFFWALYDRLAVRDILDEEAFELAARTSAGVPREFIRLLGAGFDLADEQGRPVLDAATLRLALARVRREMLGFTQDKNVRAALARIHRSRRLDGVDDWKLLNALLVVEYTNDEPWYDVHPLLRDDARRWQDEAGG